MTLGPFGLGRLEGKSIMVPNAAPGDLLDVTIASERHDYAHGRIARIIQPSPQRREAPCGYLPRCGGCDWQHLTYPAQVALKGELIAAEFRRAFGIELEPRGLVEPAPAEFGYRSRTRFKTGANGRVGFHEAGTNSLVAVARCLVAADAARVPAALALALGRRCSEIEVVTERDAEVLVAFLSKAPRAAEIARARRVAEGDRRIRGIVLRGGGERAIVGNATIAIELEPQCTIEVEADLFSQVNREQNRKLIAAVMELAAIHEGVALLDLFCGAGNFSLPAARRGARVTGVDADALAVAAANRNALRMGLGGAQFLALKAGDTARFLERARYRPELAILDPPRTGAADLMEFVARLRPRTIIYVSCDCATLVRDLRMVVARNYQIAQVRAFDFFPNTHHVEVAVRALLT